MKINNISPYNYSKTNNIEFKGQIVNKQNINKVLLSTGTVAGASGLSAIIFNSLPLVAMAAAGSIIFYALECIKPFVQDDMLQLEPKIEFKKAESVEEAEEYAKLNFKIKDFKVNDLEVANWINEGLTVLSNKFNGKVYMPRKVVYGKSNRKADASYRSFTDTLFIKEISDKRISLSQKLSDIDLTKIPLGSRFEQFCHDYENLNNISKIEKKNLLYSIANSIDIISKLIKQPEITNNLPELIESNAFGHVYAGRFALLFHEMGHVFETKSRTFNPLRNSYFAKASKDMIMPDYSLSKYQEFVSEIFAGILEGDKYPKNITDLFEKLCNIKMPAD